MIGNIIGLMTFWIDFPLWTALLMIPMALDGTVQRFTDYESNNRRRLITGLLWGFASVAMTFFLIRLLIYFLTLAYKSVSLILHPQREEPCLIFLIKAVEHQLVALPDRQTVYV